VIEVQQCAHGNEAMTGSRVRQWNWSGGLALVALPQTGLALGAAAGAFGLGLTPGDVAWL